MKKSIYHNYEELPMNLTGLQVADVLGISRAGGDVFYHGLYGEKMCESLTVSSSSIMSRELFSLRFCDTMHFDFYKYFGFFYRFLRVLLGLQKF